MKKVFILALLSLGLMVSCTKESEEQTVQAQKQEFSKFYAAMETANSRTYVDKDYKLYWSEDDRITIFDGNTYPLQYRYMGETGENHGEFEAVKPVGYHTGSPLTANYAVYPYNENATIAYNGKISYTVPETQKYAENSFGLGANIMVAVTDDIEDKFLEFKNLGGCFEFPLYGTNVKVKSIEFRGNDGEKLAGAAVINASHSEEPTMVFADNATATIMLDCGEGVSLSNDAENPTKFWIAVPAITFERGFTITITDTNSIVTEKSVPGPITIERSKVQPFENALQLVTIQNNEIWYTVNDYATITPTADSILGEGQNALSITSNQYDYDKGCYVMTFDGDITTIGASAFHSRKTVTNFMLPSSVTTIGPNAFYLCWKLTNVILPNSVTTIADNAYGHCRDMASIILPSSVTTIGAGAFAQCHNLKSITIPENVESIGNNVFNQCGSMTSVTILSNKITSIEMSTFYQCGALTSVNIPNSVTTIGEHAFRECKALTTITIPNRVTSIGRWAFQECKNMKSIVIPNSVETIGDGAFSLCSSLIEVYCKPTTPPTLGDIIFPRNTDGRKIYVPNSDDVIAEYKAANYWSSYESEIEGYAFE